MHIFIVGAGPIGLEAALQAVEAGHQVTVAESGPEVGHGVRSWGHVTFFSPWSLNTSPAGLRALSAAGAAAPDPSVFPTGNEFAEQYLEPLHQHLASKVSFLFETDVVAIGRGHFRKGDHVGDGAREGVPFRVLVEGPERDEYVTADVVIDCSGVLDLPNFVGAGGIPAIGEAELDERIHRYIPDLDYSDRETFANRRTLVVGSGMSAATTLRDLLAVQDESPKTSIVWAPASAVPYARIADDSLPQRDALAALGNAVAAGEHKVDVVIGASVVKLGEDGKRVLVTLELENGETREERVDQIIANVGYRPNNAIFEELQVHQCYASQGPMKLAATLLDAGGDCLAQPAAGADLLKNPEPGFFVLGAKSYGRNSNFLLRVGVEQVTAVMGLLA